MILQDIIHIIESVAPLSCQEKWDNSGLQVGDRTTEIKAVLLTTDITETVVSEAINKKCNLIISHHPLLFHGLKTITGATVQERCVKMAIQNDIAIYSAHTSMDNVLCGVSGYMAIKLGIKDYDILCPNDENYGLGVIGLLPTPIALREFVNQVKSVFHTPYIRYTLYDRPIRKVAICGGAGAEFVEVAIKQGADAYLTADVKYHDFQGAEGRIALVDIDHWASEHFTREIFAQMLSDKVKTIISEKDKTPIYSL